MSLSVMRVFRYLLCVYMGICYACNVVTPPKEPPQTTIDAGVGCWHLSTNIVENWGYLNTPLGRTKQVWIVQSSHLQNDPLSKPSFR